MKKPLATILRPNSLKNFFGQEKIIGNNSWLKLAIEKDQVPSLIFWGPPGSGKTTLAFIIASETKAEFKSISATDSGKKDLKEILHINFIEGIPEEEEIQQSKIDQQSVRNFINKNCPRLLKFSFLSFIFI